MYSWRMKKFKNCKVINSEEKKNIKSSISNAIN